MVIGARSIGPSDPQPLGKDLGEVSLGTDYGVAVLAAAPQPSIGYGGRRVTSPDGDGGVPRRSSGC